MKRNMKQKILAVELVVALALAACSSNGKTNKEAVTTAPVEKQQEVSSPEASNPATSSPEASSPAATESANISTESSWTLVEEVQISHATNIAAFYSENKGVTVGYAGEIHTTEDAGKTWPEASNESMCRFCVDYVDENLVWCGGNGNQVCVSKDGGKTWTVAGLAKLGAIHTNIDFIDDTTGWVCTAKKLFATKDGAKNWTEVTLPENADDIATIFLRTATEGYVLTTTGVLFITTDGGATWTQKDIALASYKIVNAKKETALTKKDVTVSDIAFTDEKTGYIVFAGNVSDGGSKVFYLKTEDGGSTWSAEEVNAGDGYLASAVALSADGKFLTLGSVSKKFVVLKNDKL